MDNISSKIKTWTTVGIISSSKSITHQKKGFSVLEYTVTDLKGNIYHLLIEEQNFKGENLEIKDVVLINTAKIIFNILSEDIQNSHETFAINIENKNQIKKIGKSKDFEFCKHIKGEKRCTIPVNKSTSSLCPFHFSQETKRIRSNRSELSGSIGFFKPIEERKIDQKEVEFKIKGQTVSLNQKKKKPSYYETAKKNTKIM